MKIVGLASDGMMPAAIADRLGKSDVVVRRYLREAVAAGLV
jgi:DNA-binding transcriptional regulator LsrR (DeoR family)